MYEIYRTSTLFQGGANQTQKNMVKGGDSKVNSSNLQVNSYPPQPSGLVSRPQKSTLGTVDW